MMSDLQDQAIRQYCKALRMPTIGGQFARLADAAIREGQTHAHGENSQLSHADRRGT